MKELSKDEAGIAAGGSPADPRLSETQVAPEPTSDPTNVTDHIPTPTPQ
jgi:hypothetical protein